MKKYKTFLIFVTFILMSSGAYIYACHSPSFEVAKINIQGNFKITSTEIKDRVESILGRNIFNLNLNEIEEKLREDVRIKDVQAKRRLPRCVLIQVEEKKPILWISLAKRSFNHGDCGFLGLSIDQELIPLTQKDLSCDLPLVSGIQVEREGVESGMLPEPYHRWSNFRVEKALEFYKTLSAIDSSSVKLLAEINMKDISNLTLYLLSGIKVMMGSDDFKKKWKRVRAVLGGGKRIQEFVCLDLRFDDQVVLTKRSKTSTLPKSQNHEGT